MVTVIVIVSTVKQILQTWGYISCSVWLWEWVWFV